MAEELGVTQSSYARFENQIRKIDFELVEKIATIFGMDTVELITLHEKAKYKTPEDAPAFADDREKYYDKEVELFRERINHLEQVVKMLRTQLADKDQIIELLRKNQRE